MSDTMKANVTCAKCGCEDEIEVWVRVNSAEDPDAAQWLIDGFLFEHECPSCGNVAALNHDCLYHDVGNEAMVLYVADPAKAEGALAALDCRKPAGYRVRLVATRDELREKAAILRDGLDDRAVEVAKAAVLNKFVGTGQVVKDARAYYGAIAEDGGIIVEFVASTGALQTTVPRDVYEGIASSFTDVQPSVIDRAWAMNVLAQWE